MAESFQKPRGTKDILPSDQPAWRHFQNIAEKTLQGVGFSKIDTPVFEEKKIYERGVGQGTDIIEKEIYLLESHREDDDPAFALRPEGTAGAARAYIENGMSSLPQPIRMFYFGPMYRHERPQKGRYREHRQIGAEIFGDQSAGSDFLAIDSAIKILTRLGFVNINVAVNSIGCPVCRPKYLEILKDYYSKKLDEVCADCRRRYETNPLRLLDCKDEKCQKIKTKAPQFRDYLCEECNNHFEEVLQYLRDFGIKFDLDFSLVRGLDYYTKTVFEISAGHDKERKSTLCGGGRYDGLVSTLGGPKTPAVGWGMGADRVVDLMTDNRISIPKIRGVEVVVLALDESAKKICKKISDELDSDGINVFYIPSKDSLRTQMKTASKLKADYAIIVGSEEAATDSVVLRDMKKSTQEDLSTASAIDFLKEKYEKENHCRTCC